MPQVDRVLKVTVDLDGFVGAPGSNTWWFADTDDTWATSDWEDIADWLEEYYLSLNPVLAQGVFWRLDDKATVYDALTGKAELDLFLEGFPPSGSGTGTENKLSRACSMYVYTASAEYVEGRRIRGGAYIGPMASEGIDDQGRVSAAALSANRAGWLANPPRTGLSHAVYRRPVKEKPGVPGRAGLAYTAPNPVTQRGPIAMLASRRD